ncbi:MAG: DUF1592 domain-containing protein [Pirellulaceae bacterium]|nr:DUF1592 domain-containing protein [Pirellulaceae bacterium]
MRILLHTVALTAGLLSLLSAPAAGNDPSGSEVKTTFKQDILPFLTAHCHKCHGGDEPEGGLGLDGYRDSANIQSDYEIWEKVQRALLERQMPPRDEEQPQESELLAVVEAIRAELAKYDCSQDKRPGRVTIRRLNRAEYNNTIRDLVGIDFRPADDFPSDDVGEGFDNIGDVLSIPPLLLEKYLMAAEAIVDRALADPDARRRILEHQPEAEGLSRREAARRNLRQFASRAFRRPVTDEEMERLFQLIRFTLDQGGSEQDAMRVALQAILASPHFLFRVERDPAADDPDGIRELDDWELATRLSYFLWSSMPDAELFRLAGEGSLRQPDVLRAQARRMLADPKSRALTENFAGQWLQLRSLGDIAPDPRQFPAFDDRLREAMLRETQMFFESIVRDDRSVLDFLTADYSYVNQQLAEHYGLEGIEGPEFRRVALPERRRGVLTQASVLLLTSNPTRTSPVKRGKWILDNILGEPPPPPPDGVEPLDENAETLGSLRQRMEQHRSNEACAVCHRKMDTLGFGLENFDVIGAWRERDGRFEIDPAGTLPGGREFRDAGELMQILAEEKREQFCRCLAEKMLTYGLGRGLQAYDRCAVNAIVKQLSGNDYRFSALITAIVTSDPFTLREARRDP